MADVIAAIGCSQIDRIKELIKGRRRAANQMIRSFSNIDGVTPHSVPASDTHVYQIFTVEFNSPELRREAINELSDRNISCKVYWDPPVHQTEYYSKTHSFTLPVTERVAKQVLSLPIHPNISETEVRRIIEAIKSAVNNQE
jgi:dTDP-4-amino-4,6-dideoxygalactose transaminase